MSKRYVLFSIGNVTPLFSAVWPACWKHYTSCNQTWVEAVQYLEVVGIIVGQVLVGLLGDGYVLSIIPEMKTLRLSLVSVVVGA